MMAYKTQVRACTNLTTGRETFYQRHVNGFGNPYWEKIGRVWYLELMAKADRRNTIVERHDANSRSVDRELFFKVSPV